MQAAVIPGPSIHIIYCNYDLWQGFGTIQDSITYSIPILIIVCFVRVTSLDAMLQSERQRRVRPGLMLDVRLTAFHSLTG